MKVAQPIDLATVSSDVLIARGGDVEEKWRTCLFKLGWHRVSA